VTVTDPYTAERAIASNNAQVITLGALITGPSLAKMLVDIWLANQFQGGNSARKVDKIEAARFAT
jgi:ribose 5-phosphate isomerase B